MKYSSKGFRGMIRDRLPVHVDIALQICKCKNNYIEHIYNKFVKHVPVGQRSLAVKQALGLKQAVTAEDVRVWSWKHANILKQHGYSIHNMPKRMFFHTFWTSINFSDLDKDVFERFKIADKWVQYLQRMYPVFQNIYDINHNVLYKSEKDTIKELESKYKLTQDVVKIILKHIKHGT